MKFIAYDAYLIPDRFVVPTSVAKTNVNDLLN